MFCVIDAVLKSLCTCPRVLSEDARVSGYQQEVEEHEGPSSWWCISHGGPSDGPELGTSLFIGKALFTKPPDAEVQLTC